MDKSTGDITKRKRPPAAGTPVLVRLQPDLLAEVDEFKKKDHYHTRPDAIRAILQLYFDLMSASRDNF